MQTASWCFIVYRSTICTFGTSTSEIQFCHMFASIYTVEPLNNGQVGTGAFVRFSEVSFSGRFHHNKLLC